MTREEACEKAKIIDFQEGYTIALVTKTHDDIQAFIKIRMEAKGTTYEEQCVLQEVLDFMEGKK